MFSLQVQLQKQGYCKGFSVKDVVNKIKKLRQKYKTEKKIRNGGVEQIGLKNGNSLQKWMDSCLKNIMLIHH